jgi:methyl-accepting chemotaxis protein
VALAAAADKIGQVVQLINDIASQTNLLALNATIEAARAGDAGKGFAVVASEVKHLATQTGRATDEIGEQIGAVQQEVAKAVDAIRHVAGTIEKVRQISSSIASAVEEQGAATQEIARNVSQASQGTQDVTSRISSVMMAAEASGNAAQQLLQSAAELERNSSDLQGEVGVFLGQVRSS